ncbi:MAG: hypothetical protein U0792_22100 [Gemmataceae bacterium]
MGDRDAGPSGLVRHFLHPRHVRDGGHILVPANPRRRALDDPDHGLRRLALFGGYAIYLPELFPTKYRSTGTSFCYNAGRLIAAVGPAALGQLTAVVFVDKGADAFRYAGVTMCSIFLVGLLVLPFLPETKEPLPE